MGRAGRASQRARSWLLPNQADGGHLADADFARHIRQQTLLARTPALDEIDGPLLFLATPASSYMTGRVLVIDGGWTAA